MHPGYQTFLLSLLHDNDFVYHERLSLYHTLMEYHNQSRSTQQMLRERFLPLTLDERLLLDYCEQLAINQNVSACITFSNIAVRPEAIRLWMAWTYWGQMQLSTRNAWIERYSKWIMGESACEETSVKKIFI